MNVTWGTIQGRRKVQSAASEQGRHCSPEVQREEVELNVFTAGRIQPPKIKLALPLRTLRFAL